LENLSFKLSFRSVDEDEHNIYLSGGDEHDVNLSGGDEHDVNLSGGDERVLSDVDSNGGDEWKQETRKIFDALKIKFILWVFWSV
jgi:hypothetical protein